MAALIEDLLALSRVSRAEMRSQTIDVSALTRAIVANLQAAEPDRRVEVVIAAQLTCRGDRNLVAIVLENLLANAWKFTAKQEHARLEVGATQSGGEIAFYVRDNGAGFDMQYATKLFAPFQRLHAESDFPGTGVGLATVRRIVHRHGGRVWAESAPGQGATFYFTLTVAGG
jgi:light-regulated signal transduction histidine kinase (bacteriophytochrome)